MHRAGSILDILPFGAIHDVRARCRCRRRRDRVVPQILHLLHCRGRGSQIIARRGAAVQVPVRIRRVITVRHDGLRAVRAAGIALPFRLIRRAARRLDIAQHPWIILIRLAHQVTVPRVSGVRSAGGCGCRRDRGCRAHGGVAHGLWK